MFGVFDVFVAQNRVPSVLVADMAAGPLHFNSRFWFVFNLAGHLL